MTDPVEKARRLQAAAQRRAADKRASLEAQRKRNRERYPELTEIIDALRSGQMLKSMRWNDGTTVDSKRAVGIGKGLQRGRRDQDRDADDKSQP